MNDIPAFAQMQNALFPFTGSILFILLHFYIYRTLLKPLSNKPSMQLLWKFFCSIHLVCCIAYLFLRDTPLPQILYLILSCALGLCLIFTMTSLLYHLCSFALIILPNKNIRDKWRCLLRSSLLYLSLCVFGIGIYNANKAPNIIHVNLEIEGLSTSIKVAVLSDIHIGGLMDKHKIKEIVTLTNQLNADMIFLVGDIVDSQLKHVEDAVDELANLKAHDGIFYVLGNHEYFHDIEHIIHKMQSLHFHVLLNQNYTNENLNIAGITDFAGWRTNKYIPDLSKALADINPNLPTILLAHQPKIIHLFTPNESVDLLISGHTHGGQIFPLSLLVSLQQPFISGLHTLANLHQTKVYVTQGAGFWGPPMRIGSQQEITLLTLMPPT